MRLSSIRRIHFVGIGGIGMSGIAEVLLTLGVNISGSDLREGEVTRRLASLGARISYCHDPSNVEDAQVLVYSSAVTMDNPEVKEAKHRGIPVIPRAEMLSELMRLKTSIVVAGSHGKTTVTAMIAHLAHRAGLDPTVVIGGRLSTMGSSARLGKSDLMVVEADESDRSFLFFAPNLAVITNIDWDHVDCYHDIEELKRAFLDFVNKVPFYGLSIVNGDDSNVRAMLPHFRRRVVTCGMEKDSNFRAALVAPPEGYGEAFDFYAGERLLGTVKLRQVGRHNAMNALIALTVGCELGVPFESISKSMADFPGVDRRFELKGERRGVRVVDDYGHHPTEIAATLKAAGKIAGNGRIIVLFQPHRYTRLAVFKEDFARVLASADEVVISEIYSAGESPLPSVNSEDLVRRINGEGGGRARLCPKIGDMAGFVVPELIPGDVVITLGAGTITSVGNELLGLLEKCRGY